MRIVLGKFKDKTYVQNFIIEVTADLLMLAIGISIGNYFKTMMF